MESPAQLDKKQAQVLMSQLLDGELSSRDAERLNVYLEAHPEDIDWMENLDISRDTIASARLSSEKDREIRSILEATHPSPEPKPEASDKVVRFPGFFRPLAAAAAVLVAGTLSWMAFQNETPAVAHPEPAVVEFVATGIPDASTFVYSDEESGWTVVWVETFEPNGEDHS